MSWMQKLYQTYECCAGKEEYTNDEGNPLLPVAHTSQKVHIEVVLDAQGNFLRAELFDKPVSMIIPATEESAGRTSGVVPHPLVDAIQYCAGDYPDFGGTPKIKKIKKNKEEIEKTGFELYEGLLGDWANSPYSTPKIKAIYKYIQKKTLVADLVKAGKLHVDGQGKLLTASIPEMDMPIFSMLTPDSKDKSRDQGKALVCWTVLETGEREQHVWKDKELQKVWIAYDASHMEGENLCMVSGEKAFIAGQHPRNIRRPGDGAKLISSNDLSGFTFRGRFISAEEACTVGYEVSHKAHNALRWLIARQGYREGDLSIVAWAVKDEKIPPPLNNDLYEEEDFSDISDSIGQSALNASLDPETVSVAEPEETAPLKHSQNLGLTFAQHLENALRGYKAKLRPTDEIVILGLDSATPGRISVLFYRELLWSDYLKALKKWQLDMAWPLLRRIEDKVNGKKKVFYRHRVGAPLPYEIALSAYGSHIDDKLKKATVARLLPCIADGVSIPEDLVKICIHRACSPEAASRETVLYTACALYKGFYARHPQKEKRREYAMSLEEDRITRDYLYGRLLGVAEYLERSALNMANEKRPTNAERLMQRFADRPFQTWLTLEKALQPYKQRLQRGNKLCRAIWAHTSKLLDQIHKLFDPEDFISPAPLSGEFLLGYHCQYQSFYQKWKKDARENLEDFAANDNNQPETTEGENS